MATDTDRFQSRFKRENRDRDRVGTGARDRRRLFEDVAERETTRSSSGVNISVGSRASHYRHTTDRTESTTRGTGDSITQRMNKLNLKEDKDTNDVDKEQEADKNEEEQQHEEHTHKKTQKKERGGASVNASRKRQTRKNLREKRRSTGVVIMPGQPPVGDDEEREVMGNTARNTDSSNTTVYTSTGSSDNKDELLKQIANYEEAIEEWKDELAKAKKEIESLRSDNTRLKDENSALLRVVGSLTTGPRI